MNDDFSPFDAPVKEPNTLKTDPSGIKIEKITDAELDGNKGKVDMPKDAPVFEIPKFDEIPNIDGGGNSFSGDPFAPGSSNNNSGNSNSGGGGQSKAEEVKIDNAFAKEFSDYTAKWMVDIFFRLVLAAFRQYAKIDKSEVLKAIEQGHIDERFLKFIDEANDNVDKSINVTEDEKKFVIEPLKYFLEVKKVQLKPEWMFLVGLLMVTGGLFIKVMDIKKDNKALLDKIIRESQSIKNEMKSNVKNQDEEFYRKRNEPPAYENIETFDPKTNNFSFTPPEAPKTEPTIEIVEVEEIPNDDED
jgi:hypothetical protein